MVQCCLAGIVSETSLLCHDGIRARCDHDAGGQVLTFEDFMGFVDDDVNSCNINGESASPLVIVETARFVRWEVRSCCNDNNVEAAESEHGVVKHPRDGVAVRDVTR